MIVYKAKVKYEPVHICEKCGREMTWHFRRVVGFMYQCDGCRVAEKRNGDPLDYDEAVRYSFVDTVPFLTITS